MSRRARHRKEAEEMHYYQPMPDADGFWFDDSELPAVEADGDEYQRNEIAEHQSRKIPGNY